MLIKIKYEYRFYTLIKAKGFILDSHTGWRGGSRIGKIVDDVKRIFSNVSSRITKKLPRLSSVLPSC